MKIADILLTILFAVFAVIQVNDPDPLLWMLLYGSVALVAGLAVFGTYNLPVTLVAVAACVAGMVWVAPGFFEFLGHEGASLFEEMSDDKRYVEESREFLGLLMALAASAWYAFRARKAGNGNTGALARP